MTTEEMFERILCELARASAPAIQLPGKGVGITQVLAVAGAEITIPFRLLPNERWALNTSGALTSVRLLDATGSTIVQFPMGSIPSIRMYECPDLAVSVLITPQAANTRVALWRANVAVPA